MNAALSNEASIAAMIRQCSIYIFKCNFVSVYEITYLYPHMYVFLDNLFE